MKIIATKFLRLLVILVILLALADSALAAVTVTAASGGGSISADTAANAPAPAWTSLGSIVIGEPASSKSDIGGGTFMLKAPAGFEFNTAVTPSIAREAGGNITAASIVVSDSTTLTITLTVSGSNSKDTLTIGGTTPVRIRPTAATPLASGNIYRPTTGGGTAVINGVTATANTDGSGGTSFGALREVAGAAKQLALQTAPPAVTAAGAAFSPQPVLLVQDQFGHTRNTANGAADNSTVVNAARATGTGALGGTTNVTAANGVATFSNLWHNKAETITVVFSSGSLSNVVSGNILVNPAPLTVRADNQNRTYGTANSPLTVTYTGFIPGETLATSGVTGSPAVSTTAQTDSPPGTYPITASLGTLAAQNYTFILSNGMLTVAKAPLTVAANDVMRLYGTTNPALTVTYTGFVLGQGTNVLSGSPSITTTAVTNSPIGSYPIRVTAGSLTSPNYAFTFVDGLLSVVPVGTLFMDTFSRSTNPGPVAPWVVQAGNWSVTGGVLASGVNTPYSYGYVYLTNVWTDYSAQALIKLSAGAYGGGLATRLNPATGARYAAWIYPAGSPGGSDVLILLKFQNWADFTVIQQASVASVGTNWHTLKLIARSNRIAAYYDGNLVISWTDPDPQPLLTGGIGVDMWNDGTAYTLSADDALVVLPSGVVAANDTYTVRKAGTLTVPAPGVLTNDTAEMGSLTALLSANPAHGTLSLSANGGFTYVPVVSYVGADTFTYRAQDGSSTSSVATVTINVTPNNRPVATNDSYTLMANTTLTMPAPGILANDRDADGDSLTAVLVAAPTNGIVSLNPDGAFTYVPKANYTGTDRFTYRAADGETNSAVATVTLSITTFTPLFSDAFSDTTLSPWVAQAGNWAVSGGVLRGGTNALSSYGYAYLTNQWSDYSAQARVRLSAGGFGGGLAGRLNRATGARYAAWIYPEGSPGGSSMLKLLKFQDWSQFTLLQQAALPAVGTNWHTLKLVMQGNRIAVFYDGTLMLSATDPDAQPLLSGGVSFDMWTDTTPWTLNADDVAVNAVRNVMVTNDAYTVGMAGTLTVSAPGVLTNDVGEFGGLTAVLATNVAHGTLLLDADGGFSYTPVSSYSGSDTFAYRATDGVNTSGLATVTITVKANARPVATNNSYTLMANTMLIVPAPGILGNDSDADGDSLTAVLGTGPTKGTLSLSSNGAFTYVPSANYTGSDSFTYRASDGMTNSTLATVSLSVTAFTSVTDTFTRTSLSPWVVQAGSWAANGSVLNGGPNTADSYGYVYLTNQWTDCSVQARVRLSAGAHGGGLGGRLNRATGARYAAWVYPEGSPGGSSMLKLLKFDNWTDFVVMQQASLPGVGTNWHTLKLVMQGNQIAAHYDGAPVLNVTDSTAPLLLSGGISFDMWTGTTPWTLTADDLAVNPVANVVATNDSYSVRMAGTLTVPAPGVLANDFGEVGSLTAILAANVAHGTLALSSNGGFAYTALGSYTGPDTFTYQCTDGVHTSSLATVTITILANGAPTAANEGYDTTANSTLTVAAPGVLANDTDPDGDPLQAVLGTGPSHGTASLSTNGGFVYTPTAGYVGSDSFTYRCTDGVTSSGLATVSISVTAFSPLFSDTFTRTSLSPWVVQAGNWAVNGSLLNGGTNLANTYGYAYLANAWTDYEVRARVQLPAGAFGGGLAGRLNPATGARYALWIYPEGSSGGSNLWKLLKFQDWESFTLLQQGSLPGVGTNWHTLGLAFRENRIALYYDGTQLTSVTDSQPYTSGGIGFELWNAATWVMSADDVQVIALTSDASIMAVGIVPNLGNQTVTVTFQGAPSTLYLVQATTNVAASASWLNVSTNLAGGDGRWTFTDSLTTLPWRFYRATKP